MIWRMDCIRSSAKTTGMRIRLEDLCRRSRRFAAGRDGHARQSEAIARVAAGRGNVEMWKRQRRNACQSDRSDRIGLIEAGAIAAYETCRTTGQKSVVATEGPEARAGGGPAWHGLAQTWSAGRLLRAKCSAVLTFLELARSVIARVHGRLKLCYINGGSARVARDGQDIVRRFVWTKNKRTESWCATIGRQINRRNKTIKGYASTGISRRR